MTAPLPLDSAGRVAAPELPPAQLFIAGRWRDGVGLDEVPNPATGAVLGKAPVGVVAAVTRFNFPFFLNLWKVGPALATGNTVVLKPSPFTPFSALVLAEAAEAAGLPPGVLNVVTGGADVGRLLATHPSVDMVTFTGSDLVGAAIMGQASATLKR